jgi:hypothetical protein
MIAWWQELRRSCKYQSHELFVLQMACEAHDEAETTRQFLAKNGRVYEDNNGVVRKRPEVAIEQNARAFFLRAVRQLGLLRTEQVRDPNKNCTVGISWQQLQRQWE